MTLPGEGPPPIGVQLGLGPRWQPTISSWRWAELRAPDGVKTHVLIFDTPLGSIGIPFDDGAVRELANQAMQRATGLTLPKANGRYTPPQG